MIRPEELRIGNYIYDDYYEIHRIENIESEKFNEYNGGNPFLFVFSKLNIEDKGFYECDEINPVSLTDEILFKFGLKQNPDSYFIITDSILFFDGYFYFKINDNTSHAITKADYLHEFQNIVYALTGKELEVAW